MFVCATNKSWKCAHNFFINLASGRACKMGLNLTANSFVYGHINRENLCRNFSVNLEGGELPKCVWTSQQTASILDAQLVKLRLELILLNLQAENFQNASDLHGKYLRFWTQKLRKCTQNFFLTCKVKSSKMHLNSRQATSFFYAKIMKMRPKHFCELWRRITQKLYLNFMANSFVVRCKNQENEARTTL